MKRKAKSCIGTVVLIVLLIAAMLAIVGLCAHVFGGVGGVSHTVTFDLGGYADGETVKPVKVQDGKEIEFPEAPVRDGYTFQGWIVDDAIYSAGDSRNVTRDLTATAKYVLSEEVDARDWYIIGDGFGSFNTIGWRHDHGIQLTRGVSAKEGCVTAYRSTVTIYAGDDFKVTYGGSWDNTQFTRNDVWVGWKHFEGDPGDGNIRLGVGEDGVYTVTLYIFSKDVDTRDHLEIEKISSVAPQPEYTVTVMADLYGTNYEGYYPDDVMGILSSRGYFIFPDPFEFGTVECEFLYWEVGGQTYSPGVRIRITDDITITGHWVPVES